MTVTIRPSAAKGSLTAPPSKSAAHRLLVCAGLAAGESTVRNVADSEDMRATLDCLRALGCAVRREDDTVHIRGTNPDAADRLLPCRECGSTLRFFVPIALLSPGVTTFTGSRTLLSRPLGVYETICREQGLFYERSDGQLRLSGTLRGGTFRVPGNISSQFISGLLFALPLLSADSVIEIIPPVESGPYIRMTLDTLGVFGVRAFSDGCRIRVPGAQRYTPQDVTVEGDYSNAAFFEALNLLGGDVRLSGLRDDSLQGDKIYRAHFAALGSGTPTIDLADCPDLGPVCMALAAAKHGAHFVSARRLRIKESDRAACMQAELLKFGVQCRVGEDDVEVFPSPLRTPSEPLCGHNDHRIVMALSLLLTRTGGTITDAQAVRKSLPDFFSRLRSLGIEVHESWNGSTNETC